MSWDYVANLLQRELQVHFARGLHVFIVLHAAATAIRGLICGVKASSSFVARNTKGCCIRNLVDVV